MAVFEEFGTNHVAPSCHWLLRSMVTTEQQRDTEKGSEEDPPQVPCGSDEIALGTKLLCALKVKQQITWGYAISK